MTNSQNPGHDGTGACNPELPTPLSGPEPFVTSSDPAVPPAVTPPPDAATPTRLTEGILTPPTPSRVSSYLLLDKLGEGGMGTVWKARHVHLKKLVALKLLSDKLLDSPDARERFRREAEAAGRLEHPNLVRATDAGDHDGMPFLVMELLDGADLARLTKERGPLAVAEACEALRQAALGLQHAHERGLVHRDFKPSNVMRTADGTVKVLDLGLARLREGASEAGLTSPGVTMGTADYMAPEQALDSTAVDVRADLYSLGCTLYHLLTGAPPFAGPKHRTAAEKRLAHINEPPPDVCAKRPEVPAELGSVVARLMAKRPEERYATSAEVAAVLAPYAVGGVPVRGSAESSPTPTARRRWLVAALALLAALGTSSWAWFGRLAPSPTRDMGEDPSAIVPSGLAPGLLTVRLRVVRLVADGFNLRSEGTLGEEVFRARRNDRVEPTAELSEPAYAYLLAFNPADKPDALEQFIPADAADRSPEKGELLDPGKRIRLDDGEGLQAFAVVASRQPLPPYNEWRKRRGPAPWTRTGATTDMVWRADGTRVDEQRRTVTRGFEEKAGDRLAVERLARWLKEQPGIDAVAVAAFAVDRAE